MSGSPNHTVALVGNPNCGKTALFNALTGSRQKVANYAGVTVERKEGVATSSSGQVMRIVDLPGVYSLHPHTLDEQVTHDVLLGANSDEHPPEAIICVVDATNLHLNLKLVLELKKLGLPTVLAVNMMDLARACGVSVDLQVLQAELGVKAVSTVAVQGEGTRELVDAVLGLVEGAAASEAPRPRTTWSRPGPDELRAEHREVGRVLDLALRDAGHTRDRTQRIDRYVLHPLLGPALMALIFFSMFQAVFIWAKLPQDLITAAVDALKGAIEGGLADGPLRSLLVDGIVSGVGSVIVFLPQIVILFAFILVLEDSGYMARAAFLMDRLMGRFGLHGRAFIPLLSSFACAVPGIMAARTIESRRDRLTTIMIAPLMTCSARLPVYALVIGTFVPDRVLWGPVRLPGAVLFSLYLLAVASALIVALLLKKTVLAGERPPLLLELPTYKWPNLRNLGLGILERARIFIQRAGTTILSVMVVLWFLSSFPAAPPQAAEPAISYSIAGRVGHALTGLFAPLGFTWQMVVALIPGLAAREVVVAALGTVYALSAPDGDGMRQALGQVMQHSWSLPTALSFLAWYVFAPQCISTLAVTRRETQSLGWVAVQALYMLVLAYGAAFLTYRVALACGLGA